MRDDLDEMRADLMDMRERVAMLDRELRDYYGRRKQLQTAINATFPHVAYEGEDFRLGPSIIAVGYTREGTAERAGLHGELDRLTVTFGPVISQRRNLHIEADSLSRAIGRLEAWQRAHSQREMAL